MLVGISSAHKAMATFNKTYFSMINGGYDPSTTIDMIDAGGGNALILGSTNSEPLLLRLVDFNGVVLNEQAFDYSNDPTAVITPTQVVKTLSGDFIVVGYYYSSTVNQNPFAAYFKGTTLTNVWFQVYQSNTGTAYTYNFSRANIVFAADDPTGEHFILSCAGDLSGTGVPNPSSNYGDMVINALKIDVSGMQLWNNKYFISGRTGTYSYITALRDEPHALTYVYSGPSGKYFIAGTSDQWYDASVWYLYGMNSTMGFAMTIDNTGAIVDQYREFTIPSYPFNQDAIWDDDPAEQSIVMSYTFGNTNAGGSGTASVMGITKFDINLLVKQTFVYWYSNATENYAYSIKRTAANDGYIMSCWLTDNQSYAPTAIENVGILKVDKNLRTPQFLERYNVFTGTMPGSIISLVDPMSHTEDYVVEATTMGGSNDIRVISADVTGKACGFESLTPSLNAYNVQPNIYAYTSVPVSGFFPISINAPLTASTFSDCNNSVNPAYYRTSNQLTPVTTKTDWLSIFPTLLSGGDNTINIVCNAENATVLSVSFYTIEGKYAGTQSFQVIEGDNTLSCILPFSVPGNYLITVTSSDKKFNKTGRISKL